jgi:hypothetical protein
MCEKVKVIFSITIMFINKIIIILPIKLFDSILIIWERHFLRHLISDESLYFQKLFLIFQILGEKNFDDKFIEFIKKRNTSDLKYLLLKCKQRRDPIKQDSGISNIIEIVYDELSKKYKFIRKYLHRLYISKQSEDKYNKFVWKMYIEFNKFKKGIKYISKETEKKALDIYKDYAFDGFKEPDRFKNLIVAEIERRDKKTTLLFTFVPTLIVAITSLIALLIQKNDISKNEKQLNELSNKIIELRIGQIKNELEIDKIKDEYKKINQVLSKIQKAE